MWSCVPSVSFFDTGSHLPRNKGKDRKDWSDSGAQISFHVRTFSDGLAYPPIHLLLKSLIPAIAAIAILGSLMLVSRRAILPTICCR